MEKICCFELRKSRGKNAHQVYMEVLAYLTQNNSLVTGQINSLSCAMRQGHKKEIHLSHIVSPVLQSQGYQNLLGV